MPGSVTVYTKKPKTCSVLLRMSQLEHISEMLLEVTKGLGAATLVLASDL